MMMKNICHRFRIILGFHTSSVTLRQFFKPLNSLYALLYNGNNNSTYLECYYWDNAHKVASFLSHLSSMNGDSLKLFAHKVSPCVCASVCSSSTQLYEKRILTRFSRIICINQIYLSETKRELKTRVISR